MQLLPVGAGGGQVSTLYAKSATFNLIMTYWLGHGQSRANGHAAGSSASARA